MAERPIRLVAFDMEGCLTADPTVWELMHRRLGTWDSHGRPYWDRYRAGEFDYDTFARMDVEVWRGAPAAMLRRAAYEVPLTPGCGETLSALAGRGIVRAIITNGLLCVAERFRARFGVEHVYANDVVARDGRLTGEIRILVPYAAKGDVLRRLAASLGIEADEVASVGDSPSDIEMFRFSRVGVAFRSEHPSVRSAATHVVDGRDLREVLRAVLPAA
jgi:phosphoserine phosphatase